MAMNGMGWTFLIVAWVSITALAVWCFYKVATTEENYDE